MIDMKMGKMKKILVLFAYFLFSGNPVFAELEGTEYWLLDESVCITFTIDSNTFVMTVVDEGIERDYSNTIEILKRGRVFIIDKERFDPIDDRITDWIRNTLYDASADFYGNGDILVEDIEGYGYISVIIDDIYERFGGRP
jgi:hypothetical protein